MNEGPQFSKRQQAVIDLLLQGKGNKQIALLLRVSERTVEYHLKNIYEKLQVSSAREAILKLGKTIVSDNLENSGKSVIETTIEITENGNKSQSRRFAMKGLFFTIVSLSLVTLLFSQIYKSPAGLSTSAPEIRPEALDITASISLPSLLAHHTATLLSNGMILIVGGSKSPNEQLASVEIYDPRQNSLRAVAALHTPRHDHSATLLQDGRVLVVGGYNAQQQWLSDAEVYDATNNTWTVTQPLFPHGTVHTATRLKDGRVLVVGGCIGGGICTDRVEFFDPRTDSWSVGPTLSAPRSGQTADLLNDGRVLISGGTNANGLTVGGDALLYNPKTNTWTNTGPMITQRSFASSVKLKNGNILVAGGIAADGAQVWNILTSAEIYNPTSNMWSAVASLTQARFQFTLATFHDGTILAIGGTHTGDGATLVSTLEAYDLIRNRWYAEGEFPTPISLNTAIVLRDDRLWVAGGQSGMTFLSDTWFINLKHP